MSDRLRYDIGDVRVPAGTMRAFGTNALAATGVPRDDAAFVVETLVHCDLRGVFSHGTRLLAAYTEGLQAGAINPKPNIRVDHSYGAARVTGDRSLGQLGARAGMQAAIEIAHDRGVGVAVASNTGHFGAAAYWALLAAAAGLIGHAASNMAGPCMLATGSRQPATGNTPLAWAFPTHGEHPVVLDMASGAYALNKLHMVGATTGALPEGVATDSEGNPTTDASKLAYVLPAGGPKGYGIGLVHDLMAGVLSGDGATLIKGALDPESRVPRGSLFFLTIDVGAFLPPDDFRTAMDAQSRAVNALPPAAGFDMVQMPGQPEWELFDDRVANGIAYPASVIEPLAGMADRLGLDAPAGF
ncbi:MAG: Ldh family oxidoreductase [Chloroflexi bacterium]|nr:Ldh family oxidoreductase [Chloroflexota bacterium]